MAGFFHKRFVIMTFMMFIIIWLFTFIPFNCLFLDPIAKAVSDFDVYDIVYSRIREEPQADTNIVLVNLSNLSRLQIAHQINVVNSFNPKVIAVDAIFQEKKDPYSDSLLADAFSKCTNLVLASKLDKYNDSTGSYDTLLSSINIFSKFAGTGFANLPNDSKVSFRTMREFRPFSKINGTIIPAFATKIVEISNPQSVQFLMNRDQDIEKINYIGNFNKFYYIDSYQVLSGENDLSFIKDKIVLIGFMGIRLNEKTLEDIFFTPLNERYAGKSFPDMYGVVIHANIVSMILNKNFINIMPQWLSIILAVILSYVSAYIIYSFKRKRKDWFGTFTKLYMLTVSLLNLYIGVMVLHHFNYRINLTLAIAVVFLTGTILDLYNNFIGRIFLSTGK